VARLELKLLGILEIQLDGTLVNQLKSRKAQALLCYLAMTSKAHSREWLAGMFWGGMPEDKARMNLSQALSTLRRIFQEHISSDRFTVSLQPGGQIWTDAVALNAVDFEDIPSLHHAAQLFRGDFLEGFYIPDCPDFEFWMLAERANCRERILQVLDHLVKHYIQQGEPGYSSAIKFNKQRLSIEPWHEETHRSLMRLYYSTGERNTALKQYAVCREILLQELGVEPDLKTTQLNNQIRDHERNWVTPGRGIQDKDYASNLPHQPTEFIGREQELAQLKKMVIDQGSQLVTITGLGGIGKTRLAVEFGSQLSKSAVASHANGEVSEVAFPDGIFFVGLEARKTADSIIPEVARAVELRLDVDIHQVYQRLKSRRLLLIIDNFEHLLAGRDTLSDMLNAAPDLQVLVTSRERLGIYGEHILPLTGLNFPTGPFQETVEFSAGTLFIKAAQQHDPDFELSKSDIEHLVRICQLVEGMPLALEIAATWSKMMPLSTISSSIQEDLQFLQINNTYLPTRHRSLYSIIERTIAGLSDRQRQIFLGLAVFEGGFTLQAAAQVLGANYPDLAGLLDKSLLRYNQVQQRYFLHPLVHQFGLERSSSDPQTWLETNHQHSLFFCDWFADLTKPSNLRSQGQRTIVDAMSADLDNTLNAWLWALNNQQYNRLIGKTNSLGLYYIWRGGYVEGARIFQDLHAALKGVESSENRYRALLLTSLSNWLAFFLDILGKSTAAFHLLQSAQEMLDAPLLSGMDTRAERAHNLCIFTRVYHSRDGISRTDFLTKAVELYRQIEHPYGLPFALATLARFKIFDGEPSIAGHYLQECLEIYQESANDVGLTISLAGLGNLAFVKNDYHRATQYFTQSIEIAGACGSPERIIVGTIFRGAAHILSGQFNRALWDFDRCEQDARERGLQGFQGYANYFLGYASLHQGNYPQAFQHANVAIPLAEQSGETEMAIQARMIPAAVHLAEGDYQQAQRGFQEARAFFQRKNFLQSIFGENCGIIGLACSEMELDKLDVARHLLRDYLQLAISLHRLDILFFALCGYTKLNMHLKDHQQAVFLCRIITSYPFCNNSRWLARIVFDPVRQALYHENEYWHRKIEPFSIWEIANDLLDNY